MDNFSANINARDDRNSTPLHLAALHGKKEVVLTLLNSGNGYVYDISQKGYLNRSLLHYACQGGNTDLVCTLIDEPYQADIHARDAQDNTPLHIAASTGKAEVVLLLIQKFDSDIDIKGHLGRLLIHCACESGNIRLVRTLIRKHHADVNARDDQDNTPLHVAALAGKKVIVFALLKEFGCDVNTKGFMGRSLLHYACESGNVSLVQTLVENLLSPLAVDYYDNTPLHVCSERGHVNCALTLLAANAPLFIKNAKNKTPLDVATGKAKLLLQQYARDNHNKLVSQFDYNKALQFAKKRQYTTRIFVLGHSGAGKSSLIEALKREGFISSHIRVSESSVPLHTAGIVPSTHSSKHYGRVLFYDFAGDAEYYSSHAAILENLVSAKSGDNMFIIVVDIRQDYNTVKNILHYWISFIQCQIFEHKKPYLMIVGSHVDLLKHGEKTREFEELCDVTQPESFQKTAHFLLDCCKPRSRQIEEMVTHISAQTRQSSLCRLSLEASTLHTLLEKNFSTTPVTSIQNIISHIQDAHVLLPTDALSLLQILLELHEAGLLFVMRDQNESSTQILLNISQFTGDVHQLLFSKEALQGLEKNGELSIGIIPESRAMELLPAYINEECLILTQLQYCQKISHKDADAFPSLTSPDSIDQSFLFFPALCTADKSDVAWVTQPDSSYSIGWLAQCTDPHDFFPPRFLHVLLLRLVFRFTLSVATASGQASNELSPGHFQRHCTMWKTGVYWLMKQGVECMVEVVNTSKEVVVFVNGQDSEVDNCSSIFNQVISCVMETKAEFCHRIKPQFFILDSCNQEDALSSDNLFAMIEVKRALKDPAELVSITRKRQMQPSKISCFRQLTHWQYLFPINFNTILQYLESLDPHELGPNLGIVRDDLESLEADYPEADQLKMELVKKWIGSALEPPCWHFLVQALRRLDHREIAEEIYQNHGIHVQLQEKLLDKQNHSLKPDAEFIEPFAGVVMSKWPSLALSLSLSESVVDEVKAKGEHLTHKDHALQILKMWVAREDATYGLLYQRLQTIPLFQWAEVTNN